MKYAVFLFFAIFVGKVGKKKPVELSECTDIRYFIISTRLQALF